MFWLPMYQSLRIELNAVCEFLFHNLSRRNHIACTKWETTYSEACAFEALQSFVGFSAWSLFRGKMCFLPKLYSFVFFCLVQTLWNLVEMKRIKVFGPWTRRRDKCDSESSQVLTRFTRHINWSFKALLTIIRRRGEAGGGEGAIIYSRYERAIVNFSFI